MWARKLTNILLNRNKIIQSKLVYKHNSALYITGDKAHNNFAVLTPHIDIEERFNDRDALNENIRARGKYVDLEGIANRWMFYLHLKDRKDILGLTKAEIGKQLKTLYADEELNKEDINKLKTQMEFVKDEYSTLKNFLYGVEESAALKALSLPNVLHSKTPNEKDCVIYENNNKPENTTLSHMKIGTEKEYLEHHNESFTFLINDAALFEQSLINYAHNFLLDNGLIQFSNADFVKTIVVEGCGVDFERKVDVITLEDGDDHTVNRLHLTGGASHYAFIAYFTKHIVMPNLFPLKYFAIGRKYQNVNKGEESSLFNLLQQSSVELFIASKDSLEELDEQFNKIREIAQTLYEQLGYHFRMVTVAAKELQDYESLRLSIQMYSNYLESYVEVGNVSICDNYLSKRLLFTYSENSEHKYPKVIIGNLINVQKVLACVIENNDGDVKNELMTDFLKQYAPI